MVALELSLMEPEKASVPEEASSTDVAALLLHTTTFNLTDGRAIDRPPSIMKAASMLEIVQTGSQLNALHRSCYYRQIMSMNGPFNLLSKFKQEWSNPTDMKETQSTTDLLTLMVVDYGLQMAIHRPVSITTTSFT